MVSVNDLGRLLVAYLHFLEEPDSTCGGGRFNLSRINYYSRGRSTQTPEQLRAARPEDCAPLILWLKKAATVYKSFFFPGC